MTASKCLIEDQIRGMFRQGQYAEAVPVLQAHFAEHEDDLASLELLSDALKYSGDKPGAAAALKAAADGYSERGMTLQSIAAQKRVMKLGVEPDFSRIRTAAPATPRSGRVRTHLLDDLKDDEFELVAERLEMRTYTDGATVVREGDEGTSLFIIVRGTLVVSIEQEGASVELARLGAGDFFGESSMLSGRPRTATIRAAGPCECLELSREGFEDVTLRFPRVLEVVQQVNEKRALSTIETLATVE